MTSSTRPRPSPLRAARFKVFLAVGLNTVVALALGLVLYLTQARVSARFDPGFPVDLLVVRNEGRSLEAVTLELERDYVYLVDELGPGMRTFDVRKLFRDGAGRAPPSDYAPRTLRIVHARGSVELELPREEGEL